MRTILSLLNRKGSLSFLPIYFSIFKLNLKICIALSTKKKWVPVLKHTLTFGIGAYSKASTNAWTMKGLTELTESPMTG